jgi:hypothetical protein
VEEASSGLVLSTDALAAALLGALAELVGYAPHFARAGEAARDALRRVRPSVVLAGCDFPDACGPGLIGPAKMMGARVLVFGPPPDAARVRDCAALWEVGVLPLPPTADELRRALAGPAA